MTTMLKATMDGFNKHKPVYQEIEFPNVQVNDMFAAAYRHLTGKELSRRRGDWDGGMLTTGLYRFRTFARNGDVEINVTFSKPVRVEPAVESNEPTNPAAEPIEAIEAIEAVAVVIAVKIDMIHNAICGAFEGGSNYWLHAADLVEGERHSTPDLVWYGEKSVFQKPFAFSVEFEEPTKEDGNDEGRKLVRTEDFISGLSVMARKYPSHFADLLSENDDGETHDVLMQCVVLGDVIFG